MMGWRAEGVRQKPSLWRPYVPIEEEHVLGVAVRVKAERARRLEHVVGHHLHAPPQGSPLANAALPHTFINLIFIFIFKINIFNEYFQ
jgi:hypothetical protein